MFAVADQQLSFIAGGITDCTAATRVAGSNSGAGWLTVRNRDAAATIYLGLTGVTSTTGEPLGPGDSSTAYYVDVSAIFALGSSTVGWGLRR